MNANTLSQNAILWNRVLAKLKETVDARIYDAFIEASYIYSIENNAVLIACETSFGASFLHDNYSDLIAKIINELTGSNYKVLFSKTDELTDKKKDELIEESNPKFLENSIISPEFTFDNFVVGPSNKEADQASLIVATNPGKLYNPLFIYSESGLGKTHLLNAIGNYIKENNPSTKVLYCSSQALFDEFQNSIKSSKDADLFKAYIKSFDVLLVDDIQFFQNKASTEEFFFNIFEYMRANNKQIVLTSDRSPSELRDLDPRLQTRFSNGLQISILKPTTEMCVDILKKKIEIIGISKEKISDDVIFLLADKFTNSIRELEGALTRLLFYSNINFIEYIDINVACDALKSLINIKDSKGKLDAQKILNIVSSYYNISVSQITGKIKTEQIANARHVAIYLIRNTLDISLKQIGDIFSGRDHTTIMHSVTKVDKMLKTDDQTKEVVTELKKRINS